MSASSSTSPLHDAQRDRLALEAAGLGVWELDVMSGRTEWNAQMYAQHGIPPDSPPLDFDEWLTRVHPDDRQRVKSDLGQLLETPAPLTVEFRILRETGEVRYLRSVTRWLRDQEALTGCVIGINEDVTERVRDRQLAEARRSELQTFFDVSQSLMCIASLDGRLLKINQAWSELMGHSEQFLLATDYLDLVHPDDLEKTRAVMVDLGEGRQVTGFINRFRQRDGSYRHIEWRAAQRDHFVFATAHDVTNRVVLEQQVAAERAYLQLIIDSLPNPVFAKDWQGRHTLANRSVANLFGTTKEAMMGQTDASMPPRPEEIDAFLRDDREVMSTGQMKHIPEESLTDARGERLWFQTTKVPLMLERPIEERQVVGIATDITDRKASEQRLKRQEALYRSLVESQQDMIVRVDTHGRFTFVNDAYCHTFGKAREELIGQTFTPLVHEDDLAHTQAALDELKQPPHPRVTIVQRAMTNNGWRWLSWEDDAILDESGNLVEIQAVGRDITALKQAQQRALTSSRAKSQFLANMSHEIRTPLNAIIGFGELLAQSPLDDEQRDWIDKVNISSHLLLSIVNDVLDYSKIEAGKLELERTPFSLEQLITQQQALFAVAIQDKGLRLRVSQESEATPCAWGRY